jgi:MYXO-CTERM domain-containing protein
MRRTMVLLSAAAGLLAPLIPFAFAPPAFADATYTYTGSLFINNDGNLGNPAGYPCSAGVGECSIQGFFTLAQPLAASSTYTTLTPESFSFTDGMETLTSANTPPNQVFLVNFSTDANGNIIAWALLVESYTVVGPTQFVNNLSTQNTGPGTQYDVSNEGTTCLVASPTDCSYEYDSVIGMPGSWSVTTTPEPDPVPLTLVGVGLLGFVARRRIAKGLPQAS